MIVLVYNRTGYEAFGDGLKGLDGLLASFLRDGNGRNIFMLGKYSPPPPLSSGPSGPPTGAAAKGTLLTRPPPHMSYVPSSNSVVKKC